MFSWRSPINIFQNGNFIFTVRRLLLRNELLERGPKLEIENRKFYLVKLQKGKLVFYVLIVDT